MKLNYRVAFIILIPIILSAFIIYKSAHYRWLGYERIPEPLIDEFTYVWQAQSLKTHGLPVGWTLYTGVFRDSKMNSQETKVEGFGIKRGDKILDVWEFRKDPRPLTAVEEINWGEGIKQLFFAAPFFDHPPLGGLIFSLGVKKDIQKFADVKSDMFRQPALVLAILNSILLYIFVYLLTQQPWIAVISVAIYSSVPTYLLASRTSFLENAVVPFVLGHLILLKGGMSLLKNSKLSRLALFLSGFLGGLAVLAKEPAVGFILGSSIIFYINRTSIKRFSVFISGVILPVLCYTVWGLWLQSSVFLSIFSANTNRGFYGSLKVVSMLEALRFKDFPVDGWWIWGFISLFVIVLKSNKEVVYLVLPLLFHFLLVLFLGSSNYPWYYLSMIPFLAACSAIFIWQIFKLPNWFSALAFFLLPVSSTFYWGYSVYKSSSLFEYRSLFIISAFFLIFRLLRPNLRIAKILWNIFFLVLLILIFKWNYKSIQFILLNWGKLPIPSLPNL